MKLKTFRGLFVFITVFLAVNISADILFSFFCGSLGAGVFFVLTSFDFEEYLKRKNAAAKAFFIFLSVSFFLKLTIKTAQLPDPGILAYFSVFLSAFLDKKTIRKLYTVFSLLMFNFHFILTYPRSYFLTFFYIAVFLLFSHKETVNSFNMKYNFKKQEGAARKEKAKDKNKFLTAGFAAAFLLLIPHLIWINSSRPLLSRFDEPLALEKAVKPNYSLTVLASLCLVALMYYVIYKMVKKDKNKKALKNFIDLELSAQGFIKEIPFKKIEFYLPDNNNGKIAAQFERIKRQFEKTEKYGFYGKTPEEIFEFIKTKHNTAADKIEILKNIYLKARYSPQIIKDEEFHIFQSYSSFICSNI